MTREDEVWGALVESEDRAGREGSPIRSMLFVVFQREW